MYTYPSNYKITNVPSTEPITLDEAKTHLRVTDTAEDTFITSLIVVAREWCEQYEHRVYTYPQMVDVHYSEWGNKMLLPINPVQSISQITYIDGAGTTQILNSDLYQLDNYSCPAFVYPAYGASYPSVRSVHNAITITYIAGYTTIPARVKHAIKLIVGYLYENREEAVEKSLNTIPLSAKNLLCERVYY